MSILRLLPAHLLSCLLHLTPCLQRSRRTIWSATNHRWCAMRIALIRFTVCRFGQADVRPYAENILNALFRIIEQGDSPQAIAANDHLMKCTSFSSLLCPVLPSASNDKRDELTFTYTEQRLCESSSRLDKLSLRFTLPSFRTSRGSWRRSRRIPVIRNSITTLSRVSPLSFGRSFISSRQISF